MKCSILNVRCSIERRGFTFVEILATLALLALVLPAIMTGISLSLSAGSQAKNESQAAALGHVKLMELAVSGQTEHASQAGDFGSDWPDYRWTAQVSQWEGTTVKQLDVTVSWPQTNHDRSITLSTLVYSGTTQ